MLHFAGPAGNQRGNNHFARGIKFGGFDWVIGWQRPLVGNAKLANLIELIAKKLETNRMFSSGCKNIEDSPSHRKLTALCDHVDALIGELNKLQGELGQEIVVTLVQAQRRKITQVARQRLQHGTNRRNHKHRMVDGLSQSFAVSTCNCQLVQAMNHFEPAANGFGAWAEAFVRQGLPRRKLKNLGIGFEALQCGG